MAQIPAMRALGDRMKAGNNPFQTPLLPAMPKTAPGSNIPTGSAGMTTQQQTPKFTPNPDSMMGKFKGVMDANGGKSPVVLIPNMSGTPEMKTETSATPPPSNPSVTSAPTPPMAPTGYSAPGYTPTYTGPDMAGMEAQIKAIFANRQSSELQKLREAREVAQQGLNKQVTTAKQGAYDARNQADVVNVQGQQRMNETMANAGLTTDGQNLTVQAGQNAARLGALTGINQQENNAMQDISERRGVIDNNAAANELALTQQINSDQAGAQYDLMKYGDTRAFDVERYNYDRFSNDRGFDRGVYQDDRDFGRSVYQDDRNFGYQAGQDQIQNDAQFGGTYNGNKTVGQTQQEWQNRFNYGNAIGQFGNGQQTMENKQFQEDRKNYGDEWAYKVARDSISDKQWQQEFDEDTRRYGLDYGLRRATERRVAANQASGGSGGSGNGAASGGVPNSGTNGDPNYPVAGPIKDPELRSQISAMESLLDSGKMSYDDAIAEINKGFREKFFNSSEATYLLNIAAKYKPKPDPNNPFGLPGIG